MLRLGPPVPLLFPVRHRGIDLKSKKEINKIAGLRMNPFSGLVFPRLLPNHLVFVALYVAQVIGLMCPLHERGSQRVLLPYTTSGCRTSRLPCPKPGQGGSGPSGSLPAEVDGGPADLLLYSEWPCQNGTDAHDDGFLLYTLYRRNA